MNDTQQPNPSTDPSADQPTGQQAGPGTATAPPPPPPAYAAAPPRRLTRTLDDKWLGGVCGGLARYANIDATLIRVLTLVAGVVFFPLPLLAYLVLWLVMPTV